MRRRNAKLVLRRNDEGWLKNQKYYEKRKNLNTKYGITTAVQIVAEVKDISVNLAFAAYVFVRLP